MVIGGLRTAVKFGLAGLATAQAAVIATLMIADRRRRRGRQHVGFPTAPPQTMPADETEVTSSAASEASDSSGGALFSIGGGGGDMGGGGGNMGGGTPPAGGGNMGGGAGGPG